MMTDEPDRPPRPVDVTALDITALAEVDAGLPDAAEAARRRTAASADPAAAAVLDALAATRADLAALSTPEVPPAVAARWAAALAAEPERRDGHREPCARSGDVGDRRERSRRTPRRRLLVAAITATVATIALGALVHRPEPPASAVTRVELVALGRASIGTMDVGDLTDPARRDACLRAVAPAAAGEPLLGGRRVVLDGRPGVLLVLATGTRGGLRILTVDPACGPGGGALLAELTA
jgi:hypothetical protein